MEVGGALLVEGEWSGGSGRGSSPSLRGSFDNRNIFILIFIVMFTTTVSRHVFVWPGYNNDKQCHSIKDYGVPTAVYSKCV